MEYEGGDIMLTLPCKHQYHSHCIKEWLETNKVIQTIFYVKYYCLHLLSFRQKLSMLFCVWIFPSNVYILLILSLKVVFLVQVCPFCNVEVSDTTNHLHGQLPSLAINFHDINLAIFMKQVVIRLVKKLYFCWDAKRGSLFLH